MSNSKGKSNKIKIEICTAAAKKGLAPCQKQCPRRGEDASHMHGANAWTGDAASPQNCPKNLSCKGKNPVFFFFF